MSIADNYLQAQGDFTPPRVPADSLLRLTVGQYHEMAQQGILEDRQPVELLEGLLVCKMTVSPAHHRTTHRIQNVLRKLISTGYFVESPSSVTLASSEPEPDVIVVRGTDDDFAQRHPGSKDIALIVEVSDTSLHRDQTFKKSIYAEAGLPIYWIVNLVDRRVEVYSDPSVVDDEANYNCRSNYSGSDELPLVIDGREVAMISAREILA